MDKYYVFAITWNNGEQLTDKLVGKFNTERDACLFADVWQSNYDGIARVEEADKMFEMTLAMNRDYVKALDENAPAEEQVRLLTLCKENMSDIVKNGLADDYKLYCEAHRR